MERGTVLLQEVTQVEQGTVENLSVNEQKSNEKSTHTSVSIQERVNSFKLGMSNSGMDQDRQLAATMQEALQVIERFVHLVGRGRHEGCLRERCASRSNPILAGAKLAWVSIGPTYSSEELLVEPYFSHPLAH